MCRSRLPDGELVLCHYLSCARRTDGHTRRYQDASDGENFDLCQGLVGTLRPFRPALDGWLTLSSMTYGADRGVSGLFQLAGRKLKHLTNPYLRSLKTWGPDFGAAFSLAATDPAAAFLTPARQAALLNLAWDVEAVMLSYQNNRWEVTFRRFSACDGLMLGSGLPKALDKNLLLESRKKLESALSLLPALFFYRVLLQEKDRVPPVPSLPPASQCGQPFIPHTAARLQSGT